VQISRATYSRVNNSVNTHSVRRDDEVQTTKAERVFKWAAVAVVSVLVFGGLYMAIQLME